MRETLTHSELGIYSSVFVDTNLQEPIENNTYGRLLRTKGIESDEGGINTGFSVIDQPFLVQIGDLKTSEIMERVPQIIEMVGLTSRSKALSEELSGGEKQRVSIARAIVHKPKLLIADEPTGNLDPVATWEIVELLFKINNQGTIVILATHDKEVVDSLERRVITMKNGKVVSDHAKGKYIL